MEKGYKIVWNFDPVRGRNKSAFAGRGAVSGTSMVYMVDKPTYEPSTDNPLSLFKDKEKALDWIAGNMRIEGLYLFECEYEPSETQEVRFYQKANWVFLEDYPAKIEKIGIPEGTVFASSITLVGEGVSVKELLQKMWKEERKEYEV